uniref:Transcription factor Dp-1 n=1 Tax=Rhabditophanes sp. KR3021 TaxID=114890 RepID=A0AC35U624_9BILA
MLPTIARKVDVVRREPSPDRMQPGPSSSGITRTFNNPDNKIHMPRVIQMSKQMMHSPLKRNIPVLTPRVYPGPQRYVRTSVRGGGSTMRQMPTMRNTPNMPSFSRMQNVRPPHMPMPATTITPKASSALLQTVKSEIIKNESSPYTKKYTKNPDQSKGLRHFSAKVCEKVKEKLKTTYSEVADELVKEYFESLDTPPETEKQQYDMKNIRRRVYDALNVLMALNMIKKDRKEITWIGKQISSIHECRRLERDRNARVNRLEEKKIQLRDVLTQISAHHELIKRNKAYEAANGRHNEGDIVRLPYIFITAPKECSTDISISNDKTEYHLNFDRPFELREDMFVLTSNKLGITPSETVTTMEDLKSCDGFIPVAMKPALDALVLSHTTDPVYNTKQSKFARNAK